MSNMKLRAFSIGNTDIAKGESDLLLKLRDILRGNVSANERRMQLSTDDPLREEDLLSYYSDPDEHGYQFCTMLRLAPGNDVQHISDSLFGKSRFTISDLHSTDLEAAAIYKSHYYFSSSPNFIVTNLPGNVTVLRLQTYINWLTKCLYEISPLIEESQLSQLADIRNITVRDPVLDPQSSRPQSPETKRSVFDIASYAMEKVKNMLTETEALSDHELSQMISAKLVIEFARPKKSDSEALKKAYAALLKPVADLENFSVRTRDDKVVAKGQDILRVKAVKIDLTELGRPNEQTVKQEMEKFLLELEHEKKASS
ncbi:hypothetical protein ACU6HM_06210 [Alcaligenes sp. RM2]